MLFPPDSRANLTKRVRALEEAWYPEKVDLSGYLDPLKSFTFPAQAKFIYDPAPLKLAQCTRRPGKSYGAGIWLIDGALRWTDSQHLWLALTREEGRRVAWGPILRAIVERLKMPVGEGVNQVQFLEGSLTVRFPNRSLIYIVGADANEKEKRKFKGQKFRRVVVDEAQDFVNGLQDLIHDVIAPAVAEYNTGQIALLGTPGEVAAGFFHGLCTGEHPEAPGWSRHFWGWRDNPHVSKEIAAYIEDQSRKIPGYKTTSTYLRNYEGKWIADAKRLVYKFDVKRNVVKALPALPAKGWRRVLGIDLGFNDDSSFVTLCYHDNSPVCYVTGAEGGPGLDITGVAEKVNALYDKHPYDFLMVDGANKQAVKELQNRHNLPLTCADKAGKADFIDIVNAAFERGELMLLEGTEALQAELLTLTWDKKKLEKLKREETQSQANHYCDGLLYAYRHTYAHLSTEPEKPKTPDEEYEDAIEAQREAARAEAALFEPSW